MLEGMSESLPNLVELWRWLQTFGRRWYSKEPSYMLALA
jgi:hypothetical protein